MIVILFSPYGSGNVFCNSKLFQDDIDHAIAIDGECLAFGYIDARQIMTKAPYRVRAL